MLLLYDKSIDSKRLKFFGQSLGHLSPHSSRITIHGKGDGVLAVLCILLAAACGYDYKDNRIPNYLIAMMVIWGGSWRLRRGGLPDMLFYLGEAALVIALIYPFFKIGTIGAGDVKLLGVTAGYLPFEKILTFLFLSFLISATISLIKMGKENNFGERMRYLSEYLADVIRSGCWRLYLEGEADRSAVGICMSGPVLIGVLLYLGGVY